MSYPRLVNGSTKISQISRSEIKEIFERLKHQPKRTLASLKTMEQPK